MERRDQLAERRRASGYSQEGLAEAIGVTSTTVARWERGAAEPLAEVRKPLARALHVSLERLNRILLGEDDKVVETQDEIDRFTSLLQRVRSLALPPDESQELIQQIAKGRTA